MYDSFTSQNHSWVITSFNEMIDILKNLLLCTSNTVYNVRYEFFMYIQSYCHCSSLLVHALFSTESIKTYSANSFDADIMQQQSTKKYGNYNEMYKLFPFNMKEECRR